MTINESVLTESSIGKNSSNAVDSRSLPRFRWYGYKEGFSRKLVEEAISSVSLKKDDYILDPFNGSGTVTLTSSINGIRSIGVEVNPFVAFMAETKMENCRVRQFSGIIDGVLGSAEKGAKSPLEGFSTFTEKEGRDKWLFNKKVISSFEGGWNYSINLPKPLRNVIQLSLIGAAMDNCNATKDGKCLKYRNKWKERLFDEVTFLKSLEERLLNCKEDLEKEPIKRKATIINNDARRTIRTLPKQFKLCITSPPYLNSFDYTDIYRPELFLGKFIRTNEELRNLRYRTIRSHVEILLPPPLKEYFGDIYHSIYEKVNKSNKIWSKQIPTMIQCYFDDMENVLSDLYMKVKTGGELWMIVANSVYAEVEIPVDLILAEIGTRNNWKLKRIEVIRYINRRKTKFDGGIDKVRESMIVFQKS